MQETNISTKKIEKTNINKQNTLKTAKFLLRLFALAVCLKTGFGCSSRSYQQKQGADESATIATLIDKEIIECENNKNHVIFWLDTNNDRMTAEGFCNMPDANSEKTSNISNLTNGTQKSLAEWRKIAHPYKVHHNPCKFLPSR